MPRELSKEHIEGFRARVGETASVLYAKGGEGAITMREIARAVGLKPDGALPLFPRP